MEKVEDGKNNKQNVKVITVELIEHKIGREK